MNGTSARRRPRDGLDPLVTCLMPTRDRRPFVPLAIGRFLAQDYARRELLVLDDGADPVADLIPPDSRIRYERISGPTVLGAKRNLGGRMAQGTVIIHWDDDDWSAPTRVTRHVHALLASGADVCGLREMHFMDSDGSAWMYVYPAAGFRPWVAGGTMCYLKSYWRRHPFPEIGSGEDTRFLWTGRPRIHVLEEPGLYVALLHRGNTSPKRPQGSRWRRVDAEVVRGLLGAEFAAYLAAARARDASTAPPVPAGVPRGSSRRARRPVRTQPPPRPPLAVRRLQVRPLRREPRRRQGHKHIVAVPADEAAAHVTVSIPYLRCKDLVARAVESILAQTHRELTVVVVNDGDPDPPWDRLDHLDDPRLVRFDLERNAGRYFADEVVLAATGSPYFLTQDADDWSDPRRVEASLEALGGEEAAAVSASSVHGGRRAPHLSRPLLLSHRLGPDLVHRAGYHALFRTSALREIGGCHGGLRIGFDTLVMNLLLMLDGLAYVDEPLYHRFVRAGSLTTSSDTGFGSRRRDEAIREMRRRYRIAYEAYLRVRSGDSDRAGFIDTVRSLTVRCIGAEDRRDLPREVERLRPLLESRAPARFAAASSAVTAPRVPTVYELLGAPRLPWGEWAIRRGTAVELGERLDARSPGRILEVGSGISTLVLAAYATRTGARVQCLEHEDRFETRTRALLRRFGLNGAAEIVGRPLVQRRWGPQLNFPWYDAPLDGPFDFVFVDGPPLKHGRQAAMFALYSDLGPSWELWLHNAHRSHEEACLQLWAECFAIDSTLLDADDGGVWVIHPRGGPSAARCDLAPSLPRPGSLAVSILTGHRPDLLQRSLRSVRDRAPGLLESSPVVVLVNGSDQETARFVRELPFVEHCIVAPGPTAPTGIATSRVLAEVAARTGAELVLHLEDDWVLCTLDRGWLARACRILDRDLAVGQVRLRHRSDPVLPAHMVTGRRIRWEQAEGYLRSDSAHLTFNPSLLRTADLDRVFPVEGEPEAQAAFLRLGWASAQLSPGAFRHVGEGRGLQATPARRRSARRRAAPARRRA